MKERIKTILLFILVFISLSLTQRLWIQLPKEMTNAFEIKNDISSYDLSDMIAPNKYLLNFGNKYHTLLNDDSKHNIWDISKVILKEVLSSSDIETEEISKDQYLKFQEERSLVFYFPEKINTYILSKTWDVKKPNNIVDTIPKINDIYIFLGSGDPFFVFSDEERYIIAYNKSIDNTLLKNELLQIEEDKNYNYYYSMREVYNIENDIYIPYEVDNSLPTVYVSNEMSTLDDEEKSDLAEMFLLSGSDSISEIVEKSGSTIYEFNNKVLKLNVNGSLEYFNPLEEKVLDRNLYISLSTVAEFITQKTPFQSGMYLSSIEDIDSDINEGYKLTFKYRIRGIPVLLGNREVGDYIQIEVFNKHIKSYKQLTRREMDIDLNNIMDPSIMLLSIDVVGINYDFLENEYLIYNNKTKEEIGENIMQEVLSAVDDISLSYYDPNLKDKSEKLIGVWAIRMNGKVYAFNAYTGELIFER